MAHCSDNKSDRGKGELWERNFCILAAQNGFVFTPMQIGRTKSAQAFSQEGDKWNHYTLPDITVWSYPGQHHEIKHKAPTGHRCFGLEVYRYDALYKFANITKQHVMYTIHNHEWSGGTDGKENNIGHWLTVDVMDLYGKWQTYQEDGISWVDGQRRTNIPIAYWNISLWQPLQLYWFPF
jgi:hypothetical protein